MHTSLPPCWQQPEGQSLSGPWKCFTDSGCVGKVSWEMTRLGTGSASKSNRSFILKISGSKDLFYSSPLSWHSPPDYVSCPTQAYVILDLDLRREGWKAVPRPLAQSTKPLSFSSASMLSFSFSAGAEWARKACIFISTSPFGFLKIWFFLWCLVLTHFSLPPIKW